MAQTNPPLDPLSKLLDSNLLSVFLEAGNDGSQGTVDTIGTVTLAQLRTFLQQSSVPPLQTVVISSPAGLVTGSVPIAMLGIVTKMASSQPCRLRLYPTASSRDTDLPRGSATPSPPGDSLLFEGITTPEMPAFNTGPTPYTYNGDTPATNLIYYTLEPTAGVGTDVTLSYYGFA